MAFTSPASLSLGLGRFGLLRSTPFDPHLSLFPEKNQHTRLGFRSRPGPSAFRAPTLLLQAWGWQPSDHLSGCVHRSFRRMTPREPGRQPAGLLNSRSPRRPSSPSSPPRSLHGQLPLHTSCSKSRQDGSWSALPSRRASLKSPANRVVALRSRGAKPPPEAGWMLSGGKRRTPGPLSHPNHSI